MLQLSADHLDHLGHGGTLIVPSRQRAAALAAAYGGAMLASGRQVWESPDILSWAAWIDRELDVARARHEPIPCRLSPMGSWLLWREAVAEAASGLDVLAPELLVDSVRRADELLEDWGLELTQASTAESALLLQARSHYRRRCRELGAIDGSRWRDCRDWLHPSGRVWLAGFGQSLGRARARWLQEHGAVIERLDAPGAAASPRPARLVQLADATLEAEAAAAWCASKLRQDPEARLLLVVPRLREQRHLWQQALADNLDAPGILHPTTFGCGSAVAIEGGEPLARHPLIAAAMSAIAVACGEAGFEQWSLLLRSAYFAALPRRDCLRLEVWQRERNLDSAELPALLPTLESALGEESARRLGEWFQRFELEPPPTGRPAGRAPRDHWARTLAALLERLGWPGGTALDEPTLQAKRQFEALLGEFAAAEPLEQPLTLREAAGLLQRLVERATLEQAAPEAPVTLTASIDDPIVRYDGLWAAGLSAAAWPQAARPDALLPVPLQIQVAMPGASAAGQLQLAREAQQRWLRASADCVLSSPRSEGDLPQDASPLLIEAGASDVLLQRQSSAPSSGLERHLAACAPALHNFSDVSGPPWPAGQPLRGGARLLELQSLCPFRAFAELRLKAQPLMLPSPGIEPHQRGRIVHLALELFWRATPDLASLIARSQSDSRALARHCAERAIAEIAMAVPRSLQSMLLARECARTAELIDQLIEWERTRAPFTIQELESTHTLAVAGSALRVRLDRVDRLEDGRLVVIDYKSGRARSFDPYEVRPQQPQLPAYAAVLGPAVAAVLAVYIDGEGVQLKGFADLPDRLRGLASAPSDPAQWQALQRRWSELVRSLAQEFLDGYAPVAPQSGACDRCQLQALCRVAPEQLETPRGRCERGWAPRRGGQPMSGSAAAASAPLERAALIEQDERARREALDPRRSLLLQAPAGSGKTTVLTARFLTLLAHVDAPEQIVAITFTRKAAAEMRNRILAALHSPRAEVPRGLSWELIDRARRRDQQLGWQLQQHPARLRIQTVDALNHGFAQALPVSARTAPSLQISDAPQELYRLAARRALQGAWSERELRPAAELLFARLDNVWSRLERLTAEMLARRAHWLPHLLRAGDDGLAAAVRNSLDALLRAELAHLSAQLPAALLLEGAELLAYAARNRVAPLGARAGVAAAPASGALRADAADLGRWRALVSLARTQEPDWRRNVNRTHGFPAEDPLMKQRALAWIARMAAVPEAGALLDSVRELPDAELSAADAEALESLALLLRRAAAELKLLFAERGRADHSEMAAAARASLTEEGEPSELALRAGGSIRHILMDEFQDTSLEQFEMLRILTAGWSAGDGRTLFLVGDPMQSIYQFREAEVGLFLRARDFGLGDIRFEALQLRLNFRSAPALIDWFNERFEPLFPSQDDARLAAIRYLPSVSPQAAAAPPLQPVGVTGDLFGSQSDLHGGAPVVTLHRFEDGDGSAEAQRVLEIVRSSRAAAPDQSIAVLVASREHAVAIAALLRDAGVAVRGVDLEPLRDRPAIRDLVALTRALLHPLDRTAWLALLRAPWCGLTLAQLESLRAADEPDLYTTLRSAVAADAIPQALRIGARRLLEALVPALEGPECALPLWQRVQRCWLRLAGPAVHARASDRLDVQRFLDALARHDAPDTLVGEALAEVTNGLYSTAAAAPGAVEIMTMHAAKGLEWDVVLLPGLGRTTSVDREPLLHWIDLPRSGGSGTDLLLCPIRCSLRQAPRSLADFIKHIRAQRERIERVRLLYVAATRARRSLHLMGWLQAPPQPSQSPRPLARSPLALLWPAIAAQFLATPTASSEHTDTAGLPASAASNAALERVRMLKRLPPDWVMPPLSDAPIGAPRPLAEARVDIAPEYRWVGLRARAVGTIVHAELHRLALSRPLVTLDELRRDVPDYRLWLAELGVPAHEHASAQLRIVRALERTLADPRGRWLLSDAVQARSEWRLTGMHEQRLVSVVFDRMLLDEHGQRWVVDFKTSVHEGAGQEQFIESELQRYHPQLQRYAALARALGPQSVRVALYFPLLGVFRELTLAP